MWRPRARRMLTQLFLHSSANWFLHTHRHTYTWAMTHESFQLFSMLRAARGWGWGGGDCGEHADRGSDAGRWSGRASTCWSLERWITPECCAPIFGLI